MRNFCPLIILLLCANLAVAQSGKPSTKEERERAVQVAQKLEANPLDKSLQSDREWFLKWAAESSDFTVSMCASGGEYKKKFNYDPELTFQKLASATAFVVSHELSQDKVEQELAAVNGALNAYEAILKADPKHHSEYWDELLKRRADGTLKEFVNKYVTQKCSGNSKT